MRIAIVLVGIFILFALFAAVVLLWTKFPETAADAPQPPPQVSESPTPVPTPTPERDIKLQKQTDALLKLFDNMPSVPVYVTNAPIKQEGANTERGVAFTNCDRTKSPTITIKKDFYLKTNQKQLTNILKHELTHAWQCRSGQMSGHDAVFRRKFAEVGGFGN